LAVRGSDTLWCKNVLRNPKIRIDAGGVEAEFRAIPITGAKAVKSGIEKFREKYGARDVKKYSSKFDVAVRVELDWLELNSGQHENKGGHEEHEGISNSSCVFQGIVRLQNKTNIKWRLCRPRVQHYSRPRRDRSRAGV